MMEMIVEVGICIAVAWPAFRLGVSPGFRRGFPGLFNGLLALLIVYAVGLVSLAVWFPFGLRLGALLAGLVWLWLAWRGRPDYGRRRGWPPGSLAWLSGEALLDDRYYLHQVSRHGPVFKMSGLLRRAGMGEPFQPMLCVYGLKRSRELLSRNEHALATPAGPDNRYIPGGMLRYMRSTQRQTYRSLFQNVFTSHVIHTHETTMAEGARWFFTTVAEAGHTSPDGVQPRPYIIHMLYRVWSQVFYGLTPGANAFEEALALYPILEQPHRTSLSQAQVQTAYDRITAMVQAQLRDFSAVSERGETPPPCFLAQLLAVHPTTADDPTALGNLIIMLNNSAQDVTGLIGWVLKMLADHPHWLARLRDEVDYGVDTPRQGATIADRIVMETLRLEQSEYLTRIVTEPIEVDTYHIPPGWWLRCLIRDSHRDPAVFADPDTFNPDRWVDRVYSRDEYSPFGLSSHACLGAQLTKTFARIFLHEFARGFEWRVISDGPREFGRYHWQPGSPFRIVISPRNMGRKVENSLRTDHEKML